MIRWLLLMILFCIPASLPARPGTVLLGIDVLLEEQRDSLSGKRIGLVTNAAAVDGQVRPTLERLYQTPGVQLVALFGPEHGVRGDAPAGAAVADSVDPQTGLPAYSLYGATREPTAAMLHGIDLILIDLPDAGARPFTYAATVVGVLRAAQRAAIPVMLLDRPNPLGGDKVEGPMLDPAYLSFVGPFAMPMRHGMTIGELARLFNTELGIQANLQVVRMRGWRRDGRGATGPWVMPSPNMPSVETAVVYPGMVLLEGTNLSEGRGTTRPFETMGAPFIDPALLADRMNALGLPGVRFRPLWFTPTASKFAGVRCGGLALHVTNRATFRPVATAIALLQQIARTYPADFRFLDGNFFDKLAGNGWLRGAILSGDDQLHIDARGTEAMTRFQVQRSRALLYRR
jgi:uncharacterized protein YbbC (DUF1343 family)